MNCGAANSEMCLIISRVIDVIVMPPRLCEDLTARSKMPIDAPRDVAGVRGPWYQCDTDATSRQGKSCLESVKNRQRILLQKYRPWPWPFFPFPFPENAGIHHPSASGEMWGMQLADVYHYHLIINITHQKKNITIWLFNIAMENHHF